MNKIASNAIVTLQNQVSPWLTILQVAPDGWNVPDFAPGQYVCLGLFGSAPRCKHADPENPPAAPDKLIQRAYSIASSPLNLDFLEFYLNLVPAGKLTPRLFNLQIGERIWLSSKITGTFTFEHVPEDANVVLIANGSGLAPYVTMLATDLRFRARPRRSTLVRLGSLCINGHSIRRVMARDPGCDDRGRKEFISLRYET